MNYVLSVIFLSLATIHKKCQSCKINWLCRCMKMSLKSPTSSGSYVKRSSDLICCHLRCYLDKVAAKADRWKVSQGCLQESSGGAMHW